MIKINKNLNNIPESLLPAIEEFFPIPSSPSLPTKTTHKHRLKIIDDGFYTDIPKFNSRYKFNDVKAALEVIYFQKCAYCEQKIESIHIEHYRPKRIYYWLAYSWDNLIISCPHCNLYKGDNFNILGQRASFVNELSNIRNINNLSNSYDEFERPLLVNPEIIDPFSFIIFYRDGSVSSQDDRFNYTIETCKISRTYLRDARRKILEDFKNDISAEFLNVSKEDQLIAMDVIIRKFIRDSVDILNPFTGFRKFAIINNWLKEIIKEILLMIT